SCAFRSLFLHSFPTRRSSDLILASFGVLSFVVEGLSLISGKGEDDGHHEQKHGRRTDQACHQLVLTSNLSLGWPCPKAWGLCKRSEEHTSELQSRGHLVCRLL